MALIEGVGDEVTLLFGSLLVLLVLLLAWVSTRTAEPPEHLFTHLPTASLHTSSSHPDTPTTASSPSTSVSEDSDRSLTVPAPAPDQTAPDGTATGQQVKDSDFGGDGVRNRGGAEGGERPATDSSSSERNMVVRLKFLNDTERTAQVKPQDTIGYIKRTYFAGQEQQVRLIYQGQLLQDDTQTLASLNLAHNCVLHCHISQHAPRGSAAGVGPADQVQVALNVGSLMVPLLVLMLSVLWYCQIQYRQFFTAPATASLVGVTIFLSLVAFGVYRR
ncbi:transmembrane and ubiquitin-like domain-containing protein 1 [Genypterus blacodes]|uniref:transmembrane and ubiquitin-like domain-containing protein 1 n=1 Tax=Genypterus blacodes TaxID=154954 RepID=UPI003F75B91F